MIIFSRAMAAAILREQLLVNEVGKRLGALDDIETTAKLASGTTEQAAIGDPATTTEQTAGIQQVNVAVASIDQGTQQNAALVEESAAAAESLKQQAAGLLGLVAAFKTTDARHAAFA